MIHFSPEYLAYIKSPAWYAFRRRALAFWGGRCLFCGGYDNIEMHHWTYKRLGHEWLLDVSPLCARCHGIITAISRFIRKWF